MPEILYIAGSQNQNRNIRKDILPVKIEINFLQSKISYRFFSINSIIQRVYP